MRLGFGFGFGFGFGVRMTVTVSRPPVAEARKTGEMWGYDSTS